MQAVRNHRERQADVRTLRQKMKRYREALAAMEARHAQTIALLRKVRPMLEHTRDEYARAALQLAAAVRAVGGGDARSRTEIFSQLHRPPRAWPELRERVARNLFVERVTNIYTSS